MKTEKKILLGNAAIAYGAVAAGVKIACGYPGTPSTEVLETVAKIKKNGEYKPDDDFYAEWSTNEKAAMEVAAGAAYSGMRAMVVMKQVGLNVASDPLMSLAYVGVKGGMVIVVADDPGPISSQTEQDTRHFGKFSNIPVLDPSSPEEAYKMTIFAFELSERIGMPVIVRPTTKVSHASGTVEVSLVRFKRSGEEFIKDQRWVIFPPLAYRRHIEIEETERILSEEFITSEFNGIFGSGELGIAAGGVSFAIVRDAIASLDADVSLIKIGTPYPFPNFLGKKFLESTKKVLVIEELDPVIEESLFYIKGREQIKTEIFGKKSGNVPKAGELRYEKIYDIICEFLGIKAKKQSIDPMKKLPPRPPVLCAGCPHRASFYAVKTAMKNEDAVFCGDIGCYTLGNAQPLNMTDTCLCMGAGITVAQGIKRANPNKKVFGFVGDSTFFASGLTGLANAVYNNYDVNIIVLDNSTTAMTGQQPHPGTGITLLGDKTKKISVTDTAKALKAGYVAELSPYDFEAAVKTVKEAAEYNGVSLIVFKAPCIAVSKNEKTCSIDGCIGCMKCINELGCPAMYIEDKKVMIDKTLCTGCGLCINICPKNAIKE